MKGSERKRDMKVDIMDTSKLKSNEEKPLDTMKLTMDDAVFFLKMAKLIFKDEQSKFKKLTNLLIDFDSKRVDLVSLIEGVKELCKGYPALISSFSAFLPNGHGFIFAVEGENLMNHPKEWSNDKDSKQGKCEMNIKQEHTTKREKKMQDALLFLKSAEDLLKKEKSKYSKLVDLILHLKSPSVSIEDVLREVKELLKGYPSLASGFNTFLPEGHEINFLDEAGETTICSEEITIVKKQISINHPDLQQKRKKRSNDSQELYTITNKKKRHYHSANSTVRLLHHAGRRAKITEILSASGYLDKVKEDDGIKAGMHAKDEMQKESYHDKGNTELKEPKITEVKKDKSECCLQTLCTPSYYILPDACNSLLSSNGRNDDALVLNGSCALVKKSMDDSFITPKNQYEECLFCLEDDRCELDMLEASIQSTIDKVESLLRIREDPENKMDLVSKHMTAQQLRCIELLYGDHGLEVLELMKRGDTPLKEKLAIILPRLQEKKEMISQRRPAFEKIWTKAFTENHQKLLNHYDSCRPAQQSEER